MQIPHQSKPLITIILLLCTQFLISCQFQPSTTKISTTTQSHSISQNSSTTKISFMYPNDNEMWNNIFSATPAYTLPPATKGAILPHHMIVDQEISKFYQGLQSTQPTSSKSTPSTQPSPPKTTSSDSNSDSKLSNAFSASTPSQSTPQQNKFSQIILIGPNHYQEGKAHIQVCQSCEFETPTGPVNLDTQLIQNLTEQGIATANDPAFPIEHAIHNHTPFIKKFFPEAKLTPIMLKWETTPEETKQLADFLHQNTSPDTLVIASVDFSHYIPAEAANFHDISSFATIHNFDYQNIYDLEVDSPPSLSTILHLMESRKAMKVTRLNHTNNQDYRSHPINSTTSHQFIAFSPGEKEIKKDLTITAFNLPKEIQEKTPITLESSYRWDITGQNDQLPKELNEIRGQEDRFLVGSDFLIFNLPPGCHPREQNNIKITFCNLSPENPTSQESITQTQEILKAQKQLTDYLYLQYPTNSPEIASLTDILITPNSPKIQAIHISPQGIDIKELSPKVEEPQSTVVEKG